MAIVHPIVTDSIDRIHDPGASLVVLIAMIILFVGAANFMGRLFGNREMITSRTEASLHPLDGGT